jgi:hypothetical protein
MTSQPASTRTAKAIQFYYIAVPRHLLLDLRDNPLAIGIYALMMRLVTATKAPLLISAGDILSYDPNLNRGAVLRAIKRLVAGGWLIETQQSGKKATYLPTWGRISGVPRPWANDAHSGRPRHVDVYRVDRRLLDVCMGKLDLHERHKAVISRYLTAPLCGLSDVGVYALALAGLHMGVTTPALERLGVLATDDAEARALPPDTDILALASQQALIDLEEVLTVQGAAKLGVRPLASGSPSTTAQTLFFMPPDQFGGLIGSLIDHMIGDRDRDRSPDAAPVSDEIGLHSDVEGSHGLSGILRETEVAAPQPPTQGGGLSSRAGRSIWKNAPPARDKQDVSLETESAKLLRDIGVKSPALITQLAQLPADVVQAAIATARSRPSTRDLGAVVGRMLRDFRDHGTPIPDPVRPANAPTTAADIRASFARLGYELHEAPLAELDLTEDDLAAADALAADSLGDTAPLVAEVSGAADALTSLELSARLRDEVYWLVDVQHRRLVDTLIATQHDDEIVISCPSAAALHIAHTHFSMHLQRALEMLKLPTVIRYRVMPALPMVHRAAGM